MPGKLIDPRPPQWQQRKVAQSGLTATETQLDKVAALAKEITEVVSSSDVKSADLLITALMLATSAMVDVYTQELGKAAISVTIARANKLFELFEIKRVGG